MSTTAWLNWEVQVTSDDPSNEPAQSTFCIVKDDDDEQYVAEVTGDQFLDECQGDDAMQNGQWQMVRMSQVTKQAPSNANTERVQCSECHKTFSSSAYMREHMRVHTGEKPYSCDECDLSFAQKCNLRMHKRIHTGERPFMCAVCGRTFSRSSHLKGHMQQHTGAKPYTCETCGQRFTNSQGKKNHMKLHLGERPFQCEICNVTFAHKPSLKMHIKTHSREARYYCSICKRKFVFRSGLYEHMTFHSKNKLYECDQCHKRFKQKNYLKKHKSTICVSRSLLQEPEQSCVREPSQLKYRVLSANEKAQPHYVDSDEEEEERARDVAAHILLQQHVISDSPDECEESFLDSDWVKVLRRLATDN